MMGAGRLLMIGLVALCASGCSTIYDKGFRDGVTAERVRRAYLIKPKNADVIVVPSCQNLCEPGIWLDGDN